MDEKELQSLLFSAVQHGNESLLDDLLNNEYSHAVLDLPGDRGQTILHVAVIENNPNCVRCLLEHGADPNIFDTVGARTPVHLAIDLGRKDIVKAFLEIGHVNLDLRDDRNLNCFEISQICDNQELVDLIKLQQLDTDKKRNEFYSVLNQACSSNDPNLVRELLKKYEDDFISQLPSRWHRYKDIKSLARSHFKELINWSSSSWNDVTLLFKTASKGYTEVCRILIEFGATAKCNENTNYSPLYVAAYGGFTETVRLLLDSFPSLVQEVTIERWTVLHACCLQGHSETAKLILEYTYPETLKQTYIRRSGQYEYRFAFDLNAQDAAGQTVIYLAVSANNEKLLDTLLQTKLPARISNTSVQGTETKKDPHNGKDNTTRAKIVAQSTAPETARYHQNSQLDKIIRQLKKHDSKADKSELQTQQEDVKYLICPFEMDTYCDYNSKTALHLAVCQQYHSIATTLLVNGSNPNLPILSRESIKNDFASHSDLGLNWLRSSKSTCLREACRLNDHLMCDILIRYGARDNPDNLALQVAALNRNSQLISKFLSLKSNPDPEFRINKKCNIEFAYRFKQGQKLCKSPLSGTTTTFSSMFPSTPVMIDWQNLKCIHEIDSQWLIDASLMHNKRLKNLTNSLIAITRLDLSSNNLKSLHPVIFRLPSLREMNLSNNRLESLVNINQRTSFDGDTSISSRKLIESHKTAMRRSKSSNLPDMNLESANIIDLNEPQEWDLPYLETLDLHDNLIMYLPDCLFKLPKLTELDVSSNQIRQLPSSLWEAPSLKEFIASSNLLDDLPGIAHHCSINDFCDKDESGDISASEKSIAVENFLSSSIELDERSNGTTSIDSSLEFDSQLSSSSLPLNHLTHWQKKVELVNVANIRNKTPEDINNIKLAEDDGKSTSGITYLNLSYNSLSHIPSILIVIASDLTRLNLSHNRLESLGSIDLYPPKLKSLDLSHNQISSWFEHSKVQPRLDHLRSINLAHNCLKEIELSPIQTKTPTENSRSSVQQTQLAYPNVTALDLSYNSIQTVPRQISRLKDLSVLNLNGNVGLNTLPPELGLVSKLWNLGISGCNLHEPLKSIVESKTYKTMDIIGYLRSILEEAKPYARMKLMLVGIQGIGKTSLLEQMRHEGSTGSRRRAPEHWTKRMGHSNKSNMRNQRGLTLSTVGVDIHDWIYCKRTARGQPSFGPVSFSTWDFGGQNEFYATHRYFLSKRSIYLVVWSLLDGLDGILGIQQWLVNIQSRASGSPVIIVGTHLDTIEGGEQSHQVQWLQEEVHKRFIDVSDHDKWGLPRVMYSIVVSTKTKQNIKNLCNKIYDTVFSLRCPGSSERLLEQKIPATYLYLEEIVSSIANERHMKKQEPILRYEEYRQVTSKQLKLKYSKVFRDLEPVHSREINYNSELQQASRFLHENGVLLHYEDASLRDLYFLDPQWLCDILSHVVTIREINPHVKNGLMQIDDLAYLFKSVNINLHGGIQSYIVNLLNKFEVALTWNTHYLLIPSLLPASPDSIMEDHGMPLKICPKTRGRSAVRRYDQSKLGLRSLSIEPKRGAKVIQAMNSSYSVELSFDPGSMMHRLILLRYLPAGFIARLQSTILSDPVYDDICSCLFTTSLSVQDFGAEILTSIGTSAGWTCWKSGIRLDLQKESTINCKTRCDRSASSRLLSIQEFSLVSKQPRLEGSFKIENVQTCKQVAPDNPEFEYVEIASSTWCDLDVTQYSNIICISVPRIRMRIMQEDSDKISFIEADNQILAKLLANSVDHIDNLLEDWYPSLGTRFAHTLGGNYLVTRLVPCSQCFASFGATNDVKDTDCARVSRVDSSRRVPPSRANFSISSANESQSYSTTNQLNSLKISTDIHCFYVEHCILNTYNLVSKVAFAKINLSQIQKKHKSRKLICLRHGPIAVSAIAPDITFDDVPDAYKVTNDQIERSKLIGRGTFGFVFRGSIRSSHPYNQMSQGNQEVALKLLQPVEPGPEADNVDIVAYNSLKSSWIREPFQCACKSYCTARHEVNLLQNLYHPNIVLFIGLCVKPLAIVLELAPMGSLADIFKTYRRAGVRIDQYSAQKIMLQVSRALEFLHQQRVIYRDLKAENVLVWAFPSPFATKVSSASVEVKLADYGISRQALSTGIWKGFAGTINFLAPEILRHHGDEEYTEKVDCFSFGMLMYELMALRPPMNHTDGSRNHLFDCGRPALMSSDLIYPNYMLDLMSVCWAQEPHYRPTASQIVSIVSTPEFLHLLDLVSLDINKCPEHGAALMHDQRMTLWLSCDKSLYVFNIINDRFAGHHHIKPKNNDRFVDESQTICPVNSRIWFGRSIFYTVPINFKFICDHPESVMSDKSAEEEDVPSTVVEFRYYGIEALAVKQMVHIQHVSKILILTESRRLVLCDTTTFVCSNLDDGNLRYNCITLDLQEKHSQGEEFRVFCGQTNGISYLDIVGDVIRRQSIIPMMFKAPEYKEDSADNYMDVSKIVVSGGSVWTAAECTLHSWNIQDKCVQRKLDCWKLAPCSESIESINIEMYYQEARSSKISSLVFLNEQLFVGTSHGCLLIIEANSLKPLAVFRPYEGPVMIIDPFLIGQKDNPNLLVTVGKKYRDLIKRYLDTIADEQDNSGCVAILWSAETYNL